MARTFKLFDRVTTLHGETDNDENDQERHTHPGTTGYIWLIDEAGYHVTFPNGAWVILTEDELSDTAFYTVGIVVEPVPTILVHAIHTGTVSAPHGYPVFRVLSSTHPWLVGREFNVADRIAKEHGDVGIFMVEVGSNFLWSWSEFETAVERAQEKFWERFFECVPGTDGKLPEAEAEEFTAFCRRAAANWVKHNMLRTE